MQLAMERAVSAPSTPSVAVVPSAVGRRLWLVLLALSLAVALLVSGPASTQAATTEAGRVTNFAANQLGKSFRLGTEGLRRYDCSGLVYRSFLESGLLNRIGGNRKLARGYYDWFRSRGLASRKNPRKGDLVVWGNAKHIGIYIGDGRAISALTTGVARHRVGSLNVSFTAYLHVRMSR